jgi:hypothetical protein
LEWGSVEVEQPDNKTWHLVNLKGQFENPVVVMGAISANGPDSAVTRVKEVTPTSFKFQIQEWSYLDKWHTTEKISYLVAEAGIHQLSPTQWIEASKLYATQEFQT